MTDGHDLAGERAAARRELLRRHERAIKHYRTALRALIMAERDVAAAEAELLEAARAIAHASEEADG